MGGIEASEIQSALTVAVRWEAAQPYAICNIYLGRLLNLKLTFKEGMIVGMNLEVTIWW